MLYSVLYGFWVASLVAFDGEAIRQLAQDFLTFAEKQEATVPLMLGHRLMGTSLVVTGNLNEGRAHLDSANVLYDGAKHRDLMTRFGQDVQVAIWSYRSQVLWFLGYPDSALTDADRAVKYARAIDHAPTLMYALGITNLAYLCSGRLPIVKAHAYELVALANKKGALFWKAGGELLQATVDGYSNDQPGTAIQMFNSAIGAYKSMGSDAVISWYLPHLARAYALLGQFEEARRCIHESLALIEKTGERWCEAEAHRAGGEIALLSPEIDAAKAEAYFDRALAVARQQQAKSWELRAAMSLARLWRDQGKVQQARELLAPVYGWFTEGFDTRDLKEAKALLEQLAV
jgi:predicted ATPase